MQRYSCFVCSQLYPMYVPVHAPFTTVLSVNNPCRPGSIYLTIISHRYPVMMAIQLSMSQGDVRKCIDPHHQK